MINKLRKYWFEFEIYSAFDFPAGIGVGCGITALNYEDAISIMDEKIFFGIKRPAFLKIIEDVSIEQLDMGHVIPNMKPPIERGIWFPLGY